MSYCPAVVHIVQRMALGGIETFVLDLARQPDDKAYIISLEGTQAELVEPWPALACISDRIMGLGAGGGFKLSLVFEIRDILREIRPASVILHHIGPLIYGGLAARLAGVSKIVHVEHDTWHYNAHPRHRLIARGLEILLRPQHICQSKATAQKLTAVLPGARIAIVPAGIDLQRFKPGDKAAARARLGLEAETALIGTVGRLVPVKGQSTLIGAYRILPHDAHLVIVGDGPERQALEAQASAHGLSDNVHFLGHRDDVEKILPAFDVFCLPSLNEGVPRSLLEAQACGVPVVATRVGAVEEAVCPETGLLVEPSNEVLLAAALKRTLAAPPACSPRRFVETHYSWIETLNSYRQLAEV
jgi:glycosyltransferase involved in cell wall biosynthesis